MDITDIPDEYMCPITGQIFLKPYITKYGHNFEKDAIYEWLSKNTTCPLTRQELTYTDIKINKKLLKEIYDYLKKNSNSEGINDELSKYVYKVDINNLINNFLIKYDEMLLQSSYDIYVFNDIKKEFNEKEENYISLKNHYNIINNFATIKFNNINYTEYKSLFKYINIIIDIYKFTPIYNRTEYIDLKYNKLVFKIFNSIIDLYNKLINIYRNNDIDNCISSEISEKVNLVNLELDLANIGLVLEKKTIINCIIKDYYIKLIKKILDNNFKYTAQIIFTYYYYKYNITNTKKIDTTNLAILIKLCYKTDFIDKFSKLIIHIENEKTKKYLTNLFWSFKNNE